MDARLLDVLLDAADEDVPPVRDDVHIDLRRVVEVLVHKNGMVPRHPCGGGHEVLEILLAVHDLHPSTAEDIRRSHEYGIANLRGKRADLVEAEARGSLRLRDPQAAHESRELPPVLREIDGRGRRPKNLRLRVTTREGFREGDGKVDGGLTAELQDHSVRVFLFDDVQDVLELERFEIEAAGGLA